MIADPLAAYRSAQTALAGDAASPRERIAQRVALCEAGLAAYQAGAIPAIPGGWERALATAIADRRYHDRGGRAGRR